MYKWEFRSGSIVKRGFTIVELLIVIVVLGILAGIVVVGYGAWHQNISKKAVTSDLMQASVSLENVRNFSNAYPASLPFSPSKDVTLTMKTNGTAHYSGLSQSQNAQLFVTICNQFMPLAAPDGSQTYVTKCVGQYGIDVTGGAHNSYLSTPIQQTFTISDNPSGSGSYYNPYNAVVGTASNNIKTAFLSQGGTFPVSVTNNTPSTLPTPDSTTGDFSTYCIEGVSSKYNSGIFHIDNQSKSVQSGPC